MDSLNQELIKHWKQLRGMTYDFIKEITDKDLVQSLPFPQSQTVANQFYCMLGTTESFVNYLKTGKWEDWDCSLIHWERASTEDFTEKFIESDVRLINALEEIDLNMIFDNGKSPLHVYLTLVEHESHHQGQIINFIYALNLPIPRSWQEKWALVREED